MCCQKSLGPDQRRGLVEHLRQVWDVSERRARDVLRVHRSLNRYQSQADDQAPLRLRIREIAFTRIRYGYMRIPEQSGHRIRSIPSSDSGGIRPPIPEQNGHIVNM
jgi:putative transposase